MKTDDKTLIEALEILARDIESGDGVANACIAEAAQRLRELTEWQPIETAPRDGTEITLLAYYQPSEEAKRNGAEELWLAGRGRWMYGDSWTGIYGGKPKYWMAYVCPKKP